MSSRAAFLALTLLLGFGALVSRQDSAEISLQASSQEAAIQTVVEINGTTYPVEVARSIAEQTQGLSGRESLAKNSGLLFPFDPPQQPSFWMREMRFPIDIVWIRDGQIVDISANLPVPEPGTDPSRLPNYQPNQTVDYVLEINAGEAAKFKIGDSAIITTTNTN